MISEECFDASQVTVLEGTPSQTDIVALFSIDIPCCIALSQSKQCSRIDILHDLAISTVAQFRGDILPVSLVVGMLL